MCYDVNSDISVTTCRCTGPRWPDPSLRSGKHELELRVERSYLFIAHYFSLFVVCTHLARSTGEALGDICGYRSVSTSDCRTTREFLAMFWPWRQILFSSCLVWDKVILPTTGRWQSKVIKRFDRPFARTKSYSTAFGNKTEGRS